MREQAEGILREAGLPWSTGWPFAPHVALGLGLMKGIPQPFALTEWSGDEEVPNSNDRAEKPARWTPTASHYRRIRPMTAASGGLSGYMRSCGILLNPTALSLFAATTEWFIHFYWQRAIVEPTATVRPPPTPMPGSGQMAMNTEERLEAL